MKFPAVYPIVNFSGDSSPLPYIERLLRAGAKILQLRGKSIDPDEFLRISIKAMTIKNNRYPNAIIMINDSVLIAKEAKADGVHLGQEDTNPEIARNVLGKRATIGLSTHNLEQIRQAPVEHLNYLALGPIFHSKTKAGHAPAVGLGMLREAKALTALPIIAIGGIHLADATEVYKAGATSIASISDFEINNNLKKLLEDYEKMPKEN